LLHLLAYTYILGVEIRKDFQMHTIEIDSLTRDFNGLRAVDGISITIDSGEIFGFLGPNGAGKTTTLRMLTGQLRPTSGTACVAGYDIVHEREALKSLIGVVFEYQNIYERLSAWDNLVFTARLYGVPKTRLSQVLEQVGLSERARESVKKFSNGMKQRLLIARALLPEPEVLFLDEPTRGLDPHMARGIREIISSLAQSGTTIFLTTHYMEEADRLCDRVAILDLGRIMAMDTPERLKATHGGGETTLEDVFLQLTGSSLYRDEERVK
jgi:ABC-2 type transport system ATP-binding protein